MIIIINVELILGRPESRVIATRSRARARARSYDCHEESPLRKQLFGCAKNNGARFNRPFMITFLPLTASRAFRRNEI